MPSLHPLLIRLNTIRSRLIELPLKMRAEWLIDLLEQAENKDLLAALCQQDPLFSAKLAQSAKDGLTILLYKKMLVLPEKYMQPILTIQEMLAESQAAYAKKYNHSMPLRAPLRPEEGSIKKMINEPGHGPKEITFYPISSMPAQLTPEEIRAQNSIGPSPTRSLYSAIPLFFPRESTKTEIRTTKETSIEKLKLIFDADLELHKASKLREVITEHDHQRNMEELVEYALAKTLNLKDTLATHGVRNKESIIAAIQHGFQLRKYLRLDSREMRKELANIGVTQSEMIEAGIKKAAPKKGNSTVSAKKAKDKKHSKKDELIAKTKVALDDDLAPTGAGKKHAKRKGSVGETGILVEDREDILVKTEELVTEKRTVDDDVPTKRKGKKRSKRDVLSRLGTLVKGGGVAAVDADDDEVPVKRKAKKRAIKRAKKESAVLSVEADDNGGEPSVGKGEELSLLSSVPIIRDVGKKLRSNELLANSENFRVLIGLITHSTDENTKARIELLLDDCKKMDLLNIVSIWNSTKVGIKEQSKNDLGFTPLMYAAKYCKNPDVIQLLMEKNPKNIHRMINEKYNETLNKQTAVEIAIKFKNTIFLKTYSAIISASTPESTKSTELNEGGGGSDSSSSFSSSSSTFRSDLAQHTLFFSNNSTSSSPQGMPPLSPPMP